MRLLSNYLSKSLISSDGLKIYYEISVPENAQDVTIFFVHGLGGDVTSWDKERIHFQTLGYKTVALDLRGHGLSERARTLEGYSLEKFSSDVMEIVRKERLTNFVLVGHCLGGIIVLLLEALYQKSSLAAVVVDTTYKPAATGRLIQDHKLINKFFLLLGKYTPGIEIRTHRSSEQFVGTDDVDLKRFVSDVIHTSIKDYFLIYRKFVSFDLTTLLNNIIVPVLIIQGTKDSVFPPEVARTLHHRIKTSELAFIKDANHIIVLNNPEELVVTIQKFLQKII